MSAFPVITADIIYTLRNWSPKLSKLLTILGDRWTTSSYTETRQFDPRNTDQDEIANVLATLINDLKKTDIK